MTTLLSAIGSAISMTLKMVSDFLTKHPIIGGCIIIGIIIILGVK